MLSSNKSIWLGRYGPMALLLVSGPEFTMLQASGNASKFLGSTDPVVGRPIARVAPGLALRLAEHQRQPHNSVVISMRRQGDGSGADFTALLHRPAGGGLVVELEPAGPPVDPASLQTGAFDQVVACCDLGALCD